LDRTIEPLAPLIAAQNQTETHQRPRNFPAPVQECDGIDLTGPGDKNRIDHGSGLLRAPIG
jgi:hypothetical protein